MITVEERLAAALDLHFDPDWGSPYWLERAKTLPFDPRQDIHTVADLRRFGPFPAEDLARRPVENFLPRKHLGRRRDLVTCETGGATGPPKRTAYLPDEFEAGFVTPFVEAACLVGFPRDLNWLFIGPSGPHIIGKAARACAKAMGSMDPFAVDFDPRWVRRLPADSMARRRYVMHVVEQAESVLATQDVGVLFATPPVVELIGERFTKDRDRIRGVHLGGMAGDETFWRRLREEWFPNATVISGYGNSLAGMCPQLEDIPGRAPEYFPYGSRLILEIEGDRNGRGRVVFHRLDESAFLPYVVERDEALPAQRPESAAGSLFREQGIADPRPAKEAVAASDGIY
jgi:hypothetical protein